MISSKNIPAPVSPVFLIKRGKNQPAAKRHRVPGLNFSFSFFILQLKRFFHRNLQKTGQLQSGAILFVFPDSLSYQLLLHPFFVCSIKASSWRWFFSTTVLSRYFFTVCRNRARRWGVRPCHKIQKTNSRSSFFGQPGAMLSRVRPR